ncbi:MAG: hypothetical protein GYA26_06905 [Flexilinea flocculi]|nr:hypothetical protein [Flexilinea flocculi]
MTLKFGDFWAQNRDTREYYHVDLSLRGGLLPDAAISALLSGDCHAPVGLAMTGSAPVALIVDLSLRS